MKDYTQSEEDIELRAHKTYDWNDVNSIDAGLYNAPRRLYDSTVHRHIDIV